jgi:hypothetical protein
MFVRFVVGADTENAAWLTGVITEARILDDEGNLFRHESELLKQTFAWLNEHLPCPPFREKIRTGEWTHDAVCWFRPGAREPIGRLWTLIAILKEHGVPVRMVTTKNPGKIVYEDEYQVVAETPYWA